MQLPCCGYRSASGLRPACGPGPDSCAKDGHDCARDGDARARDGDGRVKSGVLGLPLADRTFSFCKKGRERKNGTLLHRCSHKLTNYLKVGTISVIVAILQKKWGPVDSITRSARRDTDALASFIQPHTLALQVNNDRGNS